MPAMRCVVTGANRGIGLEFVRQLLARGDEVLAALLEELRGYAGGPARGVGGDAYGGVAVPLRLRAGEAVLSFLSTTTMFGTPIDVTLSELAIEAFLPADETTSTGLRASGLRSSRGSASQVDAGCPEAAWSPTYSPQAEQAVLEIGAKLGRDVVRVEFRQIALLDQFGPRFEFSFALLDERARLLELRVAAVVGEHGENVARFHAVAALHAEFCNDGLGARNDRDLLVRFGPA